MKFKSVYIYLVLFLSFLISVLLFTPGAKKTVNEDETNINREMPDDDIHRGIKTDASKMPSKENVSKEAIEKLNQLKLEYEKNPDDTIKIRNYADMLMLAHQPDKAIELYNKILSFDSKRIDILLHLTYLYFNKGELEKAEEISKRILSIKNNFPLALYNLGVIYHAKGDIEKAKYYWKEVIRKEPDSKLAKNSKLMIENIEKIKQ
ncbi:tetratricopeptide repeat protein [Rosettibacter firmus]|uniref:tetratricopeptide repeat protein n=1 Tax=Rosettibacter firmus TaxID=3111522 RepID=UPI00336C08A7